jgi:phosphate starvation-inducible protein PhoH and related proteins
LGEKLIEIQHINPVSLYGVNDVNLELLKRHFPKLKIVARGDKIKLVGDSKEINAFEEKLDLLIKHLNKYNTISESNIEKILMNGAEAEIKDSGSGDILVYANNGLLVKARTPNQRRMVTSIEKNDMVFAVGPAGTGKTYTAVALAVRALKNKEVKKIILTRPAVEAGENLGFLPGDLKEKLDPYLQPLYDALRDMIPAEKLSSYLETGVIQIAPLAFMRGRTLDNAFAILDEAQNATEGQLKMFLTRMGQSAKFMITGDVTQVDLPKNQPSGLTQAIKLLPNIKGIDFIHLDESDVIRHHLVKKIINAYEK